MDDRSGNGFTVTSTQSRPPTVARFDGGVCIVSAHVAGRADKIAVVNGETILLSDFQKNWDNFQEQQPEGPGAEKWTDEFKKEARQKLFDQMVDDKILQGEAKKK